MKTSLTALIVLIHHSTFMTNVTAVAGNSTTSMINIRSIAGQPLEEAYVKYQPSGRFLVSSQTNFLYLPGLNQAFHVTQNTLFKVTFQGTLHSNGVSGLNHYIQILVNDYLVIGTNAIPNIPSRANYGLGTSINEVDEKNGHFWTASPSAVAVPISKVAHIYLPPGIYSFNVGSRTSNGNGYVYSSTVTYELIQFQNVNQNAIGGFSLITLPNQ